MNGCTADLVATARSQGLHVNTFRFDSYEGMHHVFEDSGWYADANEQDEWPPGFEDLFDSDDEGNEVAEESGEDDAEVD